MPNDTNPGSQSSSQDVAPLRMLGQYIKDLSFEIPEAPSIFTVLSQEQVGLQLSANVKTSHVGDSTYEVVLEFHITAQAGERTAFLVELQYAGAVALDERVIPQEQVRPVLHIEVPRLLFPFARQIVCDLSANSGFPPLMLQFIDFGEIYARRYGLNIGGGQPAAPQTLN
jgi:preprotein translocase subunit SecB